MTLPCIACGEVLEPAVGDDVNQPRKGLAFLTRGHYGSHVFDPMDDSYLEVNICDQCLSGAREVGAVLHGKPTNPTPTMVWESW